MKRFVLAASLFSLVALLGVGAGDQGIYQTKLANGLLVIEVELRDRLLEEIDVALEAARTPLHGLFDRAYLDAGHVLRAHWRLRQRDER